MFAFACVCVKHKCFTRLCQFQVYSKVIWLHTYIYIFFPTLFHYSLWQDIAKPVCRSKTQQLEPDMEQQTGSKLGKEYVKAVYCHPAYLSYLQSTSCEMMGWMKQKLESTMKGEISTTSDMQMTSPLWQKWRRTKEPLDESERGEWKTWLKTQHSEN